MSKPHEGYYYCAICKGLHGTQSFLKHVNELKKKGITGLVFHKQGKANVLTTHEGRAK